MKIVIAGTGNVAWHLSTAIRASRHELIGILTQNPEHAIIEKFPNPVHYSDGISMKADLVILAIKDDVIPLIFPLIQMGENTVVAHTSGSMSLEKLPPSRVDNTGVFYPLQTFTSGNELDLKKIPILIEASNPRAKKILLELANDISDQVLEMDSQKRQKVHLAAVFASNFTNLQYHIAASIMEDSGLDFSLLRPLISETASKANQMHPANAQTGPAVRKDHKIMEKHIDQLENDELREIYRLLSEQIIKFASDTHRR